MPQVPLPLPVPIVGARMPALAPDGKALAFVWRGDVWVVSSTGGDARRITDHVELDAYPVFSPDGLYLAFSSLRNGNWDIFVVPTRGGAPRQITRAGGHEIATGWSPDGTEVLFSGQRDTPRPSIFSIELETGRFQKLTEDYMALNRPSFSPDGKTLLFERSGFPTTRPRYHGSAAAQLWTLDLAQGKRAELASNGLQHLWPQFTDQGKSILCVTAGEETPSSPTLGKPVRYADSPEKTPNLWRFPLAGGKPTRLTHFVGGSGVRFPSVAQKTGAVVFEFESDIYVLAPGADAPKKLALFTDADDKLSPIQRQVISGGEVEESELSPDGKTVAFKLRGDLWTTPIEKPKNERNAEDAKRLTDYPGFDGDFVWAESGKSLFFISDRDGISRLYRLDLTTREVKPAWTGKEDARSPWTTPDGKSVYFWVAGVTGSEAGLFSAPADLSAPPKKVLALPGGVQGEFALSPDQKWVAFTRRGTESPGYNLYLAPADGSSEPKNVTKLNASHSLPRFSPDGRGLFFASDRDGSGLYYLPLAPEAARADEQELKFEKPTAPVKVTIDFDEIDQRIRKLSSQSIDADLSFTDEGLLTFVSGGDVFTASYDGKEILRRTFTGGVGQLRLSEGGKKIFYQRGGQIFVHPLAAPGAATSFRAVWERDVRAERRAAFDEFWRTYNRRFHDPNFHGRDWAEIKKRYEVQLASVDTRDEFSLLLNRMVGELDASHAEVGTAPGGSPAPETRSLGFVFDYSYAGPGIKIKEVPRRSPGSYEKTRLKPGEFVMAIDGTPVSLTEDLYKKLNDKGERDFELLVNARPSLLGVRTVTFKALSGGEWNQLFYRNRIEDRRKTVSVASQGKVGYVHIAGMGGENQTRFEREFYEAAEGKRSMIIDVRENGGGNIGDTLLSWLAIKPFGTYLLRDGFPVQSPTPNFSQRAWDRPIVVLMNESSFSNAEMFPYGMRAANLATLVGMPTPGYVIWTWESRLIDGTGIRIPGQSVFRKDGTSLENRGEQPDVKIPWSAEDYLLGKDPQLEKAIEILKKK